jgi:predicted ATPase/DNA-binding SARP family transcriptional activator
MPVAEVRVLGPVEVIADDGRRIPLAAKHARLLAALVVADGRARGLDELVEAIWDGSPPASARKLVQVYVSQLRKALPREIAIETRPGGYAAPVGDALDAGRFERLLGDCRSARGEGNAALAASLAEQALGLWRGRAYGDLAYTELAAAESARLEELRLVALEERLDARLTLGRHVEVLSEAMAMAAENPFRERPHELAMLALYRCGRQADALEHYRAVRARFHEELGLEPGQALHDLQRRILQQDPSLDGDVGEPPILAALPVPPNPLVGRERELAELKARLERRDSRLVVLTGAGGTGKTRLALEIAREVAGAYANGVVLVELAPLRDPVHVPTALAHALGVTIEAEDALAAVATALAPQELLLVVDNAEHLREAAPSFVRLAAAAPRVTLLVTSRSVLHVSGEHVFPVAPLPEDDAVELFSQRAAMLEPRFGLSAENEEDVRQICRRLDGLPLAIELAAAQVRVLTPRTLRERLDRSLGVLVRGPRDLPARQQTLREALVWSVDLLGERERDVFVGLSVFPSGATLEAAEAVCGADLPTLAALVDDHLVRTAVVGESRFGMLETMREYALELLGEERASVELALADYFADIADDLRLAASSEQEWRRIVERLEPEIDNVRVGLAAAAAFGDAELLVRLAGGLWRYWQAHGPVGEGLEWIERALTATDGQATPTRSHALQGAAALAWMQGDLARARALAEAAIPIAIAAGSTWDEMAAHTVLGILSQNEDDADLEAAHYHHTRSLELSEELGIEPLTQKLNLGVLSYDSGDFESALTLLQDALEGHQRNANSWGMGFAHLNLAVTHFSLGDSPGSRKHFERARVLFERVGFRERVAHALQGLAVVDVEEARFEEAAYQLGHARRILDEIGTSEARFWTSTVPAAQTQARDALGDGAFEDAYAAGREGVG